MRFITKVSILLLGSCVVAGGGVAWSYKQPSVSAAPFQRASWISGAGVLRNVGDPGCVRGAMALDLVDSNRLLGLSGEELTALLGPATYRGNDWMYPLGQCSGFGWEDSALMIKLGSERRAISARFQRAP